jgi:hypothetical protein
MEKRVRTGNIINLKALTDILIEGLVMYSPGENEKKASKHRIW